MADTTAEGQDPDGEHVADVVPIRPAKPSDTSYEHELDDDPEERVKVHEPGGIPLPKVGGDRLPVIPEHLSTPAKARKHLAGKLADGWYEARFHALRSPLYLVKAVGWALWGVLVIAERLRRWWWVTEQSPLRSLTVVEGDTARWLSLHNHARKVRGERGAILGTGVFGVLLAVVLLAAFAPWWLLAAAGVAALPLLARAGRPAHRPIVTPSMTTPRFRVLDSDSVLRAYYVARLGDPEKAGQQVTFGGRMSRDGDGSSVMVDLPYGRTFEDAMKARAGLASGLDVKLSQVHLGEDPSSDRRHTLWVADTDPLAIPAGPTPLLDCKERNIWKPAPLGLDERGRKVAFLLLWISVLIGAQARKGKTFAARLLALYAALDPYVRLTVIDGKNSPDWQAFRLVAHRLIGGTHPTRDGDPVEQVLDALREIKAHIMAANDFLKSLPVTECPEGKLTEALARKYPQLRVWLLVMEELQVYFELEDQKKNAEIASLLAFIQAVGPSVGVILMGCSQKPSGVGAGDVARLFNRIRDLFTVRLALKCGTRIASEAVLGSEAYQAGFDAAALPSGKRYRGVGILYNVPELDYTPTVRTYLADAADAEVILLAARAHRERHGTLTGMAADEALGQPGRDALADVHAMFLGAETGLQWATLAERLAGRIPERWEDATDAAVSAQLRDLGVPSVDVKASGTVKKGCRKSAVEHAMGQR